MAAVLAVAGAAVVLSGCGPSGADNASEDLRTEVESLRVAAADLLRTAPDAGTARERFAEDHGSAVFDSAVEGDAVRWDLVLLEQAAEPQSWDNEDVVLRTCVRLSGRPGAGDVTAVTVACPQRLASNPAWGSFDRDVDVLG